MKSVRTKNYINRPQILIRVWYVASTRIRLPYAYHTRIWLPYAYHTLLELVKNVIHVTDHVSGPDTRITWSHTRTIRVSPEE